VANFTDNLRIAGMDSLLLILLFTLLSGLGDAIGFVYASKVWQDGHFHFMNALKSVLGFQFGIFMYWFATRYLAAHGVIDAEVQTLFWFAATIIGIALISGQFPRWALFDKAVAVGVLAGIACLMLRTAR
jgi:hypothetical protein